VAGWLALSGLCAGVTLAGTADKSAPAPAPAAARGKELFANHCAGCHGDKGDGNGRAAPFLYPRPRNFGEAKFRLATTANRQPTDQDLLAVITRGMPGSAMFPFAHLPEADRLALVAHVRQLTRAGIEERVRQEAAKSGEDVDADDLAKTIDRLTRPGRLVEIPADLPATGAESVARGQKLYQQSCAGCHGTTGKGDGQQDMRDDNGMPTRPRDFTRGIFKGGREVAQLYTRIRLGMPGTPMPASDNLKPPQVGDLVNYVLSLSGPGAAAPFEHRRTRLVARRTTGPLPEGLAADAWQSAQPVKVVVSPLWWRNYDPPDLQVQALHDGRTLALRLSWLDATRNDAPVRPQDFEDMVAVQLFQGAVEPFLGMGAGPQAVDVWLWQAGAAVRADVETVFPRLAVDYYPFAKGAGSRSAAAADQPPGFLTARAAGNLRSDLVRPLPATSLQAKGPGTLTMRPRPSQLVGAQGRWQAGRWTVVFRRPLGAGGQPEMTLRPGERLSVAFAVWDGEARDRNGQKMVSIWQDLQLE
jgi:mono/diheme cytochrome c family protein